MKVLVTILSSLLIATTVFAKQGEVLTPGQSQERVKALADIMMKEDIRKVITFTNEDLCGPGPSYKIEVQVKTYNKVPDKNGNPEFVEVWKTIKTYAITPGDLGSTEYSALPMDLEQCL